MPSSSVIKCVSAFIVDSYPFNRFSFVGMASQTVIKLSNESKSAVGTYYLVTAPKDGNLYILADDLCESEAIIAAFDPNSCVVMEGISRPQNSRGYYTHETNAYGHRGAYVKFTMKKKEQMLLFVGAGSTADGIVHFKMTFDKDDTPFIRPSAFILTKLFWVIFGYIIIGLAIFTLIVFSTLYWFTNKNKVDYGRL